MRIPIEAVLGEIRDWTIVHANTIWHAWLHQTMISAAAASGSAKLVKLRVEGLPIGADASVADKAVFGIGFGHILRQT